MQRKRDTHNAPLKIYETITDKRQEGRRAERECLGWSVSAKSTSKQNFCFVKRHTYDATHGLTNRLVTFLKLQKTLLLCSENIDNAQMAAVHWTENRGAENLKNFEDETRSPALFRDCRKVFSALIDCWRDDPILRSSFFFIVPVQVLISSC